MSKDMEQYDANYFETNQEQPSLLRSAAEFIAELVKVILVSLAIIIPVRYYLIQPFYVKGASMEPNFYDNEYLIIDEISYRFREPQRGEIVVFKYPMDKSQYFIKRIIGLPNETVEIQKGEIIISNQSNQENQIGFTIDESQYLSEPTNTSSSSYKVALGAGEYFLLGDNRDMSLDSRNFGGVSKELIIGRAWFRGWPFTKITVFKAPEYGSEL